ncbi:zinc finger protein CONSTANS-LIKE 15-like [Dendrobium catenatum]|uniref:zinc finger protein CONSTANS-LIKE 15-like n=1 Tax=Dendrobium catenatum TaxID=906689 RepID=UPI0010A01439|nr:zinc finger protein CONSTANS-LIKE 15-like [Dendrobium catenatum]
MPNFDYEDNLFREAGYSPRVLSSTNNGVCSSDVPVTITFPEPDTNIANLPGYDNSFNSELISSLINPQLPPEPEPNSFPSLPAASMAPIHPMNQPNPMICNPPFTSNPPNSVVNQQLPSGHLGLPGYMGMEPSAMQRSSFMDANGGIGGQLYAERMRMPTFVADDGMGKNTSVGMPVRPMEAAEACNLRGIYTYEPMPRLYSPGNLQVLRDNQNVRPMCSTSIAPLQMPSDIPRMDDSNNKVSRASPEERRKKLDRYLRKKKERNFSKTIKYTCRKILADSRPRVRGRFAKIEEFSDVMPMPSFANDEEIAYGAIGTC